VFLQKLQSKDPKNEAVQSLSENCWLIRASDALHFLGEALADAARQRIQYRVHFFEKEPEWIHSEGYGKTT
jgi:hypothetical protein